MAIDIFSARELTRVVLHNFKPKTWLRNLLVKSVQTHNTRTIQVDTVTGRRIMAVFSSPVSKGVPVRAQGYTTKDITPGYIKLRAAITPGDIQDRLPGENLFYAPGQAPALLDRAEQLAVQHLSDMYDATARRIEYMTLTAITTGKVQVVDMNEAGSVVETREIDFGFNPTHTVTPTVDWDGETADILGDLVSWAQLCAKDGGMVPNTLIVDSNAAVQMMKNDTILKYLDARYANAAEMQIALDTANGVTDMGVLRGPGLTVRVFVYNEWYEDPATGTLAALWPADTVWLGNTAARTEIHCRPIEDMAIGKQFPETNGGNLLAVPYFVKSWDEENPSVRNILFQSGPIVVPHDLNAFVTAKVLNNEEASV